MQSTLIRRLARTYVYLGRSLPTYGCACENVWGTYGHTDGANTGIRTGVTPETYSWNTGKPTGVGTAVKRKPFHGMYRIRPTHTPLLLLLVNLMLIKALEALSSSPQYFEKN